MRVKRLLIVLGVLAWLYYGTQFMVGSGILPTPNIERMWAVRAFWALNFVLFAMLTFTGGIIIFFLGTGLRELARWIMGK